MYTIARYSLIYWCTRSPQVSASDASGTIPEVEDRIDVPVPVTTHATVSTHAEEIIPAIDTTPNSLSEKVRPHTPCDHRGATPESFTPLLKISVTSGEELKHHLNDFCPMVTQDRFPSPELWNQRVEYVPKWLLSGDRTDSEPGLVHMNAPAIFRSDRTGVYFVSELPNKVMKYYKYCMNLYEPIDATVNEGFFMSLLATANIAPHFYYYSGYIDTPYEEQARSKITHPACKNGLKPHIRYLIMDEVGEALEETMFKLRNYRFSFITALKLGGQMVELLKTLYSFRIVHGDIHLGNFAFRSPRSKSDIIFLDFGRARIVGPDDVTKDSTDPTFCSGKGRFHEHLSKWEMFSCKTTFRDDMYRAIQTIGHAMWGVKFLESMSSLITREYLPHFVHVKESGRFFNSATLGFSISSRVEESSEHPVSEHLNKISQIAVQEDPSNPNAQPDYDGIIYHIKEVIRIIYEVRGIPIDEKNMFIMTDDEFDYISH